LPEFSIIFSRNESESKAALKKWRERIIASFSQIEGKEKNFLSSGEIRTLVESGLIKVDPDPSVSTQKVLGILEILGFKGGVSHHDVLSLFDWLEQHRLEARTFYEYFISVSTHPGSARAENVLEILNFIASFIALGGDEAINPKHLTEIVTPWIPLEYTHSRAALGSGVDLTISFFSSFCGDRVDPENWNGKKIGLCIKDLATEFKETTPVFDLVFSNLNPVNHKKNLKIAALAFETRVRNWLLGHHHPLFPTQKVSDFAKALQIPPPYAFIKLTEWIPKLNADSTSDALSPTLFLELAGLVHHWIDTTLDAFEGQPCNETGPNWKDCGFNGRYDPADQLFNVEYATLVRERTLGYVSKVALYHELSGFIFTKLDPDHSGVLKASIKELLTLSIRLLDSSAFTQNVISGLLEKPTDPSNLEDSLRTHARQGLAELAALVADLIPDRGENSRSLLRKLESEIIGDERNLTYSIDRIGLTAFIYTYDLIAELNSDYRSRYDLQMRNAGTLTFIKRRKVMETLPRILFDHFPRLYNECLKWGFERTCGVIFSEILPNANPDTSEIQAYEMDVISLSGVLLESMMNRCDRDHDDRLNGGVIDGYDEKTCMITVGTTLAKRLMNAGFVDQNANAKFLINLTRHFVLAKWAAKASLARGTLRGIAWYTLPGTQWLSGPATLGSVLSVSAEIMDPAKVEAIEKNTIGHADSAGDELIYLHQLTDHYLPSTKEAPRYKKFTLKEGLR
jgi:hypothetical protein